MQVSQLTGQKSRLFNKILASSLLLIGSVLYAEPIGDVRESTGASQVTRQTGESYEGAVDLSVLFMDKMETMKGRMKVELIDESVFTITEHSMVIVDKFIYDPNPTKSTLALTFAKGTARFVTSKTGKIPKENISINTSSATIGIRGTDFTVTVDELGRTLVVLLPDETGRNLLVQSSYLIWVERLFWTKHIKQLWYKVMMSYQKKLLSYKVLLFL